MKGNLNSNQEKSLKITTDLIWKTYFLPADFDNDGSVQELELIAYMKQVNWFKSYMQVYILFLFHKIIKYKKALNDEHKLAVIDITLGLIFDAIDSNQDEKISNKEYSNFLQSIGILDKTFVENLFDIMDSNHDGVLNREGINV